MTTDEQLMPVTTILIKSVYSLLPQVRDVIQHHPADASRRCKCHDGLQPCRDIDTAIAALDLVFRIRVQERSTAGYQPSGPPTACTKSRVPFTRGLERLRAELATRSISPDACVALLTILASIDTARRILATESAPTEIFNYGVLLGMLDRAQSEVAELDPER